jgi:chemotaxis protein methyltransferase CheR
LRLLSAGCASGEEAYSLAILLKRQGRAQALDFEIQGLDLNPEGLTKARCARYSPWSLRETPVEVRERWFQKHGRDYQLDDSIRSAVRFDQHNLILSSPTLLPARSFDIIFCRNVLMYFTSEHASAIVAQLARALAPGGFLFLGHAETLRGLSSAFHLRANFVGSGLEAPSEDDTSENELDLVGADGTNQEFLVEHVPDTHGLAVDQHARDAAVTDSDPADPEVDFLELDHGLGLGGHLTQPID